MQHKPNRPIFVVGSPRSGTSILTWCLGHHPNVFPVPESNWMGDFAVNVAVAYQIGASRGEYSLLSAMDLGADELFAAFGCTINELILRHRSHLESKREAKCVELKLNRSWLDASSSAAGIARPKKQAAQRVRKMLLPTTTAASPAPRLDPSRCLRRST